MATNIEALGLIKDLLRLGREVSLKAGEYVSIAKSVPASVTSAADELGAMRTILSELEDNFQDFPKLAQLFPRDAMNDLHLVLTSCKKVFAQLRIAMHKFLGLEKRGAFTKMFMSWRVSFAEKDLAKIHKAVIAHKATLNITLLLTKRLVFISQGNPNDASELLGRFREQARRAELDTPSDVDVAFSDVSSDYGTQTFTPHSTGISELDSAVVVPTPVVESPPAYQMPSTTSAEREKETPQAEVSLPIHTRNQVPARFVAPVKDKDHKPRPATEASDTDRTLIEAARTGDVQMMEIMLMLEPDVNGHHTGTGTALAAAVMSKKIEAVQLLLDRGAHPNVMGKDFSALKRAAEFGQAAIGLLLLQLGADPNLDERGLTAFCLAARNNRVALLTAMIKHGADVNLRQGEASAISLASSHGRPEIARLLLDAGVDVNVHDKDGNFALTWASLHGHVSVVQMLVETPGLDVNMKNNAGVTALINAAKAGHAPAIELLVSHGADPNIADQTWGNTALIWASWEGKAQRYPDAVAALVAAPGIQLDHRSKSDGTTALRAAAHRGHIGAVRVLLAAGADAFVLDTAGNRPLMWAAADAHVECVAALLDVAGGQERIDAVNAKGATALYETAAGGHEPVVALLLERGADPTVKGGADGSALMTAVKGKRMGVVKLLMAKGARK